MAIDVKTGAAAAPRAWVVVCHGVYHNLLNDFGNETVMDDMKGWIGSHLS